MDLSLEPVSRTLWIPLVGRALARQRRPDLGFSDPESERILARAMGGPLFDVAHLRVPAGYTAR